MKFGKCIACHRIRELIVGDLCSTCLLELKQSFHYGIGGKEVSKKIYDRIVKRGYLIPEEIDDERLEEENEKE